MEPRPKIPRRGVIHGVNPNPVVGRDMRDRHDWVVLTPEAVNVHGRAVAVVISTVAAGARAAGLTVPIVVDGVIGVAVCTQVRNVDPCARISDGSASLAGVADPDMVGEIAARLARLIDP